MRGLTLDGVETITFRDDIPEPTIEVGTDVVVKVERAGLCGSDLHPYLGREPVRFGVIPQIVPPFASFTLFRWDINVRTSTIIGFVGGGGIGFFLYQWIIKADFRAVSSSFIAIAIIVIVLDFVSARIRARLV